MRRKEVSKGICFLILLSLVFAWTNDVLRYKSAYGPTVFEAFYEQGKDTIDVLFVGTSHVYCDINPAYVYDETGICSYDLSTAGAPMCHSYYAIKQALEYQKPKVIVLELFGVFEAGEYRSDSQIMDAGFGIRNPVIKMQFFKDASPKEKRLEFFLEWPFYHTFYNRITKRDFRPYNNTAALGGLNTVFLYDDLKNYKGAVTVQPQYPVEALYTGGAAGEAEIYNKNEEYLEKIVALADEKKIPLCFVISPSHIFNESTQMQFNYVKSHIAEEHNIPFIDGQSYADAMGIEPTSDFADGAGHLNYKGMEKYSRWLARQIDELYDIEDKRGTYDARTWDENLRWEREVSRVFDLRTTNSLKEYLGLLDSDNYVAYISFAGDMDIYSEAFSDTVIGNMAEHKGSAVLEKEGLMVQEIGEKRLDDYGDDMIAIEPKTIGTTEENVIVCNAVEMRKVNNGVNIVVYDKYMGEVVDVAGFNAADEMNVIR